MHSVHIVVVLERVHVEHWEGHCRQVVLLCIYPGGQDDLHSPDMSMRGDEHDKH